MQDGADPILEDECVGPQSLLHYEEIRSVGVLCAIRRLRVPATQCACRRSVTRIPDR